MQDALLFLMQQIVLLWIRCVVARVRLDFRYVVVRLRLDGCKIKFWKTYVVWNYYAPGLLIRGVLAHCSSYFGPTVLGMWCCGG